MSKRALVGLGLAALLSVEAHAQLTGYQLVYTRQPNISTPFNYNAMSEPPQGWQGEAQFNIFQGATEVGSINTAMSEADIVIDKLDGVTPPLVIHNCTGSSAVDCVAQEAKVSPDGTKIAYSVGFGAKEGNNPGDDGIYEPTINGLFVAESYGLGLLNPINCSRIWVLDLTQNLSTVAPRNPYPVPNYPDGDCSANSTTNKAIDRAPAWLDNTNIVFVSNRAGKYPHREQENQSRVPGYCSTYPDCISQTYDASHSGKAMQLYKMSIDRNTGGIATNLTPEGLNILAPEVMSNGDIYASCYNAHAEKGSDLGLGNSSIALANLYWLCRWDSNGADMTVQAHGHKVHGLPHKVLLPINNPLQIGDLRLDRGNLLDYEEIRGLRNVAEIFKGKISFATYYRGNHLGSNGAIYGMPLATQPWVEGCLTANCLDFREVSSAVAGSGQFMPEKIRVLTPWGQSGDAGVGFMHISGSPSYRAYGKAGYPGAWDGDHYTFTHSRGQCIFGEVGVGAFDITTTYLNDTHSCRKTIVKVRADNGSTVEHLPLLTNPYDSNVVEYLVNDSSYNAWDGKRIASYQTIYGQAAPTLKAPLNSANGCFLQIVDGKKSELYIDPTLGNLGAHPQMRQTKQCTHQGCSVQTQDENLNFIANNAYFFRVRIPTLWDVAYNSNQTLWRYTMNTVGHKDLRHYQRLKYEADGSLKMQVPCNTPLIMSAENSQAEKIAEDPMLHSLRPGETRTCHGCHDGHSVERQNALNQQLGAVNATPQARFNNTRLAYAKTPSLKGTAALPKWAQIQPIIERTCASSGCHGQMSLASSSGVTGESASAIMYSKIVWDPSQQHFVGGNIPRVFNSVTQGYEIWRPYTSRLVHSTFAIESPLYWYAKGQRADGRLNSTRSWDIDYDPTGSRHPFSKFTADDLRILREWLDNGSPYQ